jgi:Uma2 family endonuclease
VEKPLSYRDDCIGTRIIYLLSAYLETNNIGAVSGAQGMIRFKLDLVRVPDVSFIRWDSVDHPDELENPAGALLDHPPDLTVEVLSPSNTRREMEIKLGEYAKAGVKLVWYVDPERQEVDVYSKANTKRKKTLGLTGTLDGAEVLPGFTLHVAKIFEKRALSQQTETDKKARKEGQEMSEANVVPSPTRSLHFSQLQRGSALQHFRITPASTPRMVTSWRLGSTTIGSIVLFIGSRRISFFFL